jgi:hypothetical protein
LPPRWCPEAYRSLSPLSRRSETSTLFIRRLYTGSDGQTHAEETEAWFVTRVDERNCLCFKTYLAAKFEPKKTICPVRLNL